MESVQNPHPSQITPFENYGVTVTEEIDLKSQPMSNISVFLKWRNRLSGILAGVYYSRQPSKKTFLYSGWEEAVVHNWILPLKIPLSFH